MNDGETLKCISVGRFKIIFFYITGLKEGRLPGRGIYKYNRFKPFYLAWGLLNRNTCLLREYNTSYVRIEIVPIRVQIYITPKDVYEHWQELKRKQGKIK